MEPYFGLNYILEGSENFDDLLIYLDKNFVERKLAATLHPVQGIRKNDDGTFTIHFSCILVSFELVFTPGVEFEELKPDGQKVISLIEFEGNTIKHSQRDAKGRTLYHVYEFTPETMTIITISPSDDVAYEGLKDAYSLLSRRDYITKVAVYTWMREAQDSKSWQKRKEAGTIQSRAGLENTDNNSQWFG